MFFLNDLTVAKNGDVYVTESMKGSIYYLKAGTDSLQLFLSPAPFTFPNGIKFSDRPGQLFVSTSEGTLKIDVGNRHYDLLKTNKVVNAKDIDGLDFYHGTLIGHQSTKVVRFTLNEKQDSITYSSVLDTGPEFDSSTTGESGNGHYYFIVNSQVRSGIDFVKQAVKPLDSLEKIIIRKISL